MKTINKFTLKSLDVKITYYKEKDIELSIKIGDVEDVFEFENRKDFFYFINQLTDAAEEIKEMEE